KLSLLTGLQPESFLPNKKLQEKLRSRINMLLSLDKKIENNKHKVDLKPNVDFVENNIDLYQVGVNSFFTNENRDNNAKVAVDGSGALAKHEIPEARLVKIIQSRPDSLRAISDLKKVFYFDLVLVPHFKKDGNFDDGK